MTLKAGLEASGNQLSKKCYLEKFEGIESSPNLTLAEKAKFVGGLPDTIEECLIEIRTWSSKSIRDLGRFVVHDRKLEIAPSSSPAAGNQTFSRSKKSDSKLYGNPVESVTCTYCHRNHSVSRCHKKRRDEKAQKAKEELKHLKTLPPRSSKAKGEQKRRGECWLCSSKSHFQDSCPLKGKVKSFLANIVNAENTTENKDLKVTSVLLTTVKFDASSDDESDLPLIPTVSDDSDVIPGLLESSDESDSEETISPYPLEHVG